MERRDQVDAQSDASSGRSLSDAVHGSVACRDRKTRGRDELGLGGMMPLCQCFARRSNRFPATPAAGLASH